MTLLSEEDGKIWNRIKKRKRQGQKNEGEGIKAKSWQCPERCGGKTDLISYD